MVLAVLDILVALVISRRARQIAWFILYKRRKSICITMVIIVGVPVAAGIGIFVVHVSTEFAQWLSQPSTVTQVTPPTPPPSSTPAPVATQTPCDPRGCLPWDQPLNALRRDLSGPSAAIMAVIVFVVVFGIFIFGGELNHLLRSILYIVIMSCVLVTGINMLSSLGISP